jgi:hypothetical protein
MSGYLAGKVWRSALDKEYKPICAAIADCGDDDGRGIYPSIAYIAWLTGASERTVQYGFKHLREIGALEIIANKAGGRGNIPIYHLLIEKLPQRPQWKKGATDDTLLEKGAIHDAKGCNPRPERVQPVAPDPSVEPLEEPPVQKVRSKSTTFKYSNFSHRYYSLTGTSPSRGPKFQNAYAKLCSEYEEDSILGVLPKWVESRGGRKALKGNNWAAFDFLDGGCNDLLEQDDSSVSKEAFYVDINRPEDPRVAEYHRRFPTKTE